MKSDTKFVKTSKKTSTDADFIVLTFDLSLFRLNKIIRISRLEITKSMEINQLEEKEMQFNFVTPSTVLRKID